MARRNATTKGVPLNKWAPGPKEVMTCALHKLPLESRKGKRYGRVPGKGVQAVDADIWFCPAGCTDPHVIKREGEEQDTFVPGLTAWKRPLAADLADANLAAYKENPKAYLAALAGGKIPSPAAGKPADEGKKGK